jgi:hypothetical protein
MSLYEAKHFCAPVNLELFPAYAFTVKYPMDLSTIKARLEHRFYRRLAAVEYDVLRIRTNALIFNDPEKSDIVETLPSSLTYAWKLSETVTLISQHFIVNSWKSTKFMESK